MSVLYFTVKRHLTLFRLGYSLQGRNSTLAPIERYLTQKRVGKRIKLISVGEELLYLKVCNLNHSTTAVTVSTASSF